MAQMSDISSLLSRLNDNLDKSTASEDDQQLLSDLKVHSRDQPTVQRFFTADVIALLAKYGLGRQHSDEALRCLANALYLVESNRQAFVDAGFATLASRSLNDCSYEREFLLCRILFLLTYRTDLDFDELDTESDLCMTTIGLCQKHSKQKATAVQDQALDELLKLLFNVTHFFPATVTRLTPAVLPIICMLTSHILPKSPLDPPTGSMINALLALDLEAAVQSSGGELKNKIEIGVGRLVEILRLAVRAYSVKELDVIANPLCTLLRKINETGNETVKQQLVTALLPQEQDRSRPLGEGDSLPAHLLRISIKPDAPNLGSNISALLFELSDKDTDRFVHNIGFGFASGFLLSHGMTAPVLNERGSVAPGTAVNPITGQHQSNEELDDSGLSEMTEEEKEREAERLFVLFERLKATGVVDVKNPVEKLYKDD